jgi:hypothetical protein
VSKRDESGFRHGLRVRIGAGGPKGQLLRCEKRHGSGHYWKVRLDTGPWVWPDDLILDGPGDHVERCMDCRLPFMGNVGELLCAPCQEDQFGTPSDRSTAARDDSFRRRGPYHRRRTHS